MQHPRPLFKRNISVAGWMPLSSLLKQLKLTTASNTGVYAKVAILDEYLVDHWMLTHDHHLNDRLRLSHASRRCRRQRRGLRVGAINYCMSIHESNGHAWVNSDAGHRINFENKLSKKHVCPLSGDLWRYHHQGRSHKFAKGDKTECLGDGSPSGVQGQSPSGSLGAKTPEAGDILNA